MSLAEGAMAAKEAAIAIPFIISIAGFFGDGDDGDDGDGGPDTPTPKTQPPTRVHSRK